MKLRRKLLSIVLAGGLMGSAAVLTQAQPASAIVRLCDTCGLLGTVTSGNIVPGPDYIDYRTTFAGIDVTQQTPVFGDATLRVYLDVYGSPTGNGYLQVQTQIGYFPAKAYGQVTKTAALVTLRAVNGTAVFAFDGSKISKGQFQISR